VHRSRVNRKFILVVVFIYWWGNDSFLYFKKG
jgi:hypothetical protein